MVKISLNVLGGRSPLGTLPFFVKLLICVFIDYIGLIFMGMNVLAFPIALPITYITYGILMGVVSVLFWAFPLPFAIVAFGAKAGSLLALPMMTAMCLWHGFKTRWRY